jgi:hypothetical protein
VRLPIAENICVVKKKKKKNVKKNKIRRENMIYGRNKKKIAWQLALL